ncbi:hypothetical protein [Actinoplanes sp. NPDC049118]|uniref:hypothetical protein n=1 Tax=Actinoplanes sp. NPDC049118 TaxID=3155769 RepID=UPI0033E7FEFF
MNLDTEDQDEIFGATEDDIRAAITRLTSTSRRRWAVLRLRPHYYIQCYIHGDDLLDVYYREGGPDRHYISGMRQPKNAVTDAFLSYLYDDNRWRTAFEWQRQPEEDQ